MSTLANVGGLPDNIMGGFLQPKQTNKWRVNFFQFGSGVDGLGLTMQAKKVGRPELKFETHKMHRYNSVAKVLGKHDFTDLTITFDDDIGNQATALIQQQLQKQQWIIGADGNYLAASRQGMDYKFATQVDMLDGNDGVLESWTYEGCMISNFKTSDLSYESSDIATIDLTISIDHMYQTIPGGAGSASHALGGSRTT